MIKFGTNFSLGILNSIFAGISMITILFITKFTVEGKRSWMYIIAAIMSFICCLIYIFLPSITTVIIYNLVTYISRIIFRTMYDYYRNSSLKEAGLYSEITEHQVTVEIILDTARVISIVILLLAILTKSLIAFKIYFAFSVLAYAVVLTKLLIYEKKFSATKNEKINEKTQQT